MAETEKKLAKSLSSENVEIIPFLPYLLQDLWEMGSSFTDINELISKHLPKGKKYNILDLASGKGAVSIKLGKALAAKVKGIDIVPEFIEYARTKAKEYAVEDLVTFEVNDINKSVNEEKNYDIVIYGAVGDVLGKPAEILKLISKTVKSFGYIIIDEAYSFDGVYCPTRKEWLNFFTEAGLKLLGEKTVNENEQIINNRSNQDCIINRANELIGKYPDKEKLFNDYVEEQQAEIDILESEIIAVTWLLQKNN